MQMRSLRALDIARMSYPARRRGGGGELPPLYAPGTLLINESGDTSGTNLHGTAPNVTNLTGNLFNNIYQTGVNQVRRVGGELTTNTALQDTSQSAVVIDAGQTLNAIFTRTHQTPWQSAGIIMFCDGTWNNYIRIYFNGGNDVNQTFRLMAVKDGVSIFNQVFYTYAPFRSWCSSYYYNIFRYNGNGLFSMCIDISSYDLTTNHATLDLAAALGADWAHFQQNTHIGMFVNDSSSGSYGPFALDYFRVGTMPAPV